MTTVIDRRMGEAVVAEGGEGRNLGVAAPRAPAPRPVPSSDDQPALDPPAYDVLPSRVASDLADDVAAVLSESLVQARRLLSSDTATVLLKDQTGRFLDTVAAVGIEANVHQRARVPIGAGFAGRVAQGRQSIVVDDVRADNVVNPLLRRRGLHSLLGVPILDQDELIGVLHVGSVTPRRFTGSEQALLEGISRRMAHALAEELAASQQAAAGALQHSLLPSVLPTVPGLDLAARYLPAVGSLGGDWYDVFSLPTADGQGRLAIVIGDVAGHGLDAAIVMGRLRSAVRAYAVEFEDPADVLSRLDQMTRLFEPGSMATVLYAVIEPPYDQVWISSSGHLAPVIVHPDKVGAATPVELRADPPIGVIEHPRHSLRVDLPQGVALLLFTDGLVERRPPSNLRYALNTLCAGVSGHDAEEIGRVAIDLMFSEQQPDDDVALVVLRREPT
jgi:sigma-B regulation protein RsbU (phosphoserine phosphatase)